MITPLESYARATTIWTPGTVTYSQVQTHSPDGYRQDCSGYVSLCWALATPGENTVSLVTEDWMREIPVDQLRMGDAVGLCGPNTGGNGGHIQWVESYRPGQLIIWEQAGSGVLGQRRRVLKGINPGYRAYRFNGMTGEDDMAKLFKTADSASIWASDGVRRRALHSWPLVQQVYGQNPPIIVVANAAELDDAAGPVDSTTPGAPVVVGEAALKAAVRDELDKTKLTGTA